MRSPAISRDLHRLAELGRVSASLLHEISNPLTSALLHIEQYTDQNAPAIKEARRNIKRIYDYVEAARQQARGESRVVGFALQQQIAQLKRLVMPLAKQAGVRLIIDDLPRCRLYGDPVKFQQILSNLVVNAIEAYDRLPAKEPVRVELSLAKGFLQIKVSDSGKGIRRSNLSQIFEPFFTTKGMSGKGLGIGLAIVRQYVKEDFKGSLAVSSSPRHGTVFHLKLPVKGL